MCTFWRTFYFLKLYIIKAIKSIVFWNVLCIFKENFSIYVAGGLLPKSTHFGGKFRKDVRLMDFADFEKKRRNY
jgi:hypothetical protein